MKTLASKEPRGELIASPSICSYKAPSNWKSLFFFVAAWRRSIKSVLESFKLCVLLNQSWTKAFSGKICIVSSKVMHNPADLQRQGPGHEPRLTFA